MVRKGKQRSGAGAAVLGTLQDPCARRPNSNSEVNLNFNCNSPQMPGDLGFGRRIIQKIQDRYHINDTRYSLRLLDY